MIEESLHNFARFIYTPFEDRRNVAKNNLQEFETSRKHNLTMTNRLWEDRKRFLKSERGAWAKR